MVHIILGTIRGVPGGIIDNIISWPFKFNLYLYIYFHHFNIRKTIWQRGRMISLRSKACELLVKGSSVTVQGVHCAAISTITRQLLRASNFKACLQFDIKTLCLTKFLVYRPKGTLSCPKGTLNRTKGTLKCPNKLKEISHLSSQPVGKGRFEAFLICTRGSSHWVVLGRRFLEI